MVISVTPAGLDLAVEGMSCASCVRRVETALQAVPGVQQASVNLATHRAHVTWASDPVDPELLLSALSQRGYDATPIDSRAAAPEGPDPDAAESALASRRLLVAAALTLPVFLLEMGSHLIPGMHDWLMAWLSPQHLAWTEFALSSAVLLGPGRLFFSRGWRALRHATPDMNTLVALGAGSAWLYSSVVTFAPGLLPESARHLYFEAAAVVATLILLGRWLEARAKGRAGAAIRELVGLQPRSARVRREQRWVEVPIDSLQRGDEVQVRPGEKVPLDGNIIEGSSWLDESMMTGEPMPVARGIGDPVIGGTLNTRGSLVLQVTATGADTVLAQIIQLVEQAQLSKLPVQRRLDQITAWFVPLVMGLAGLAFVLWFFLGPEPALTHALVAGVAVLIIACPCAMGLATPISILIATSRAARLGILFRWGDALQDLRDVKIIAFDKTGTLTVGKPSLSALEILDAGVTHGQLLAELAAAQSGSEHPIAHALRSQAQAESLRLPVVEHFEAIAGAGIAAQIAGHTLLIGSTRLLEAHQIALPPSAQARLDELASTGQTPFVAARDGQLVALMAVSDTLRPSAKPMIAQLHALGIQTALITGDHPAAAQAVATALGIDRVYAQTLPDQKAQRLAALQTSVGALAFVGDGINDAPALAHAQVGIAMGHGTDVAIESADIVLMNDDLTAVVRALTLSQRTLRNIAQNLFWAFAYNVALIPVAAGALYPWTGIQLSPMLGAGAMALSSVFVVTNALRLKTQSLEPTHAYHQRSGSPNRAHA